MCVSERTLISGLAFESFLHMKWRWKLFGNELFKFSIKLSFLTARMRSLKSIRQPKHEISAIELQHAWDSNLSTDSLCLSKLVAKVISSSSGLLHVYRKIYGKYFFKVTCTNDPIRSSLVPPFLYIRYVYTVSG